MKQKQPPDKKKRTRKDRSEKLKGRKAQRQTVVKSCLYHYTNGKQAQKAKIKDEIEKRVFAFSKRIVMASLALLTLLKELFQNHQNVLEVELPDITDQTFVRQLLCGTESAHNDPNPTVEAFQNQHPEFFEGRERYLGDWNIYTAGGIKYITNLKNSLWMNLSSRIKTFVFKVQVVEKLTDYERKVLRYSVMGWDKSKIRDDQEDVIRFSKLVIINKIAEQHRTILGLKAKEAITSEWGKTDCNKQDRILKYFVHLNRYYEANSLPTFNIIPICTLKRHFITLDTASMFGVLKNAKCIKCTGKTFEKERDEHWKRWFKIHKLAGSFNTFTRTVETDGLSLCTHFVQPKEEKKAEKEPDYQYNEEEDRVIGMDTGRQHICHGAEILLDGTVKEYVLSRQQYYEEGGIFEARRNSFKWNLEIKDALEALSQASSKGVNIASHEAFLATFFEVNESLWDEYFKARWARQKMTLHSKKQKTLSNYFNGIQNADPTKRVVMAYGAAKFDATGKGELSVPTTKIYQETILRFKTYLIDEFRTSKICYKDDSVLRLVSTKKKPRTGLRGLLWCGSTTNKFFIDRDLNAALNIRRCLIDPVRPASLTRSGQPAIRQSIGITIRW